jgi:hypothetical protein
LFETKNFSNNNLMVSIPEEHFNSEFTKD